MIRIGVLGYGYWGPKIVRTLVGHPSGEVAWACDASALRLKQIQADHPGIRSTADYREVFADRGIDAVVLATPADTHYPLAMEAMGQGKHVFVEKPIALTANHAAEMVAMADRRRCVLMVGHVFEFAPWVQVLKHVLAERALGDVWHIYAHRASLGPRLRTDVNVVWDYAIHDVYVALYLLNVMPDRVVANGQCHYSPGIEDSAAIGLHFPNGLWALLYSSWIAPVRERTIRIVGSNGIAVYDEAMPKQVLVYRRGFAPHQGLDPLGNRNWRLFEEGMEALEVPGSDALRLELDHFLECIETNRHPRSDGRDGLRTLRVLEAANMSLRQRGREVLLASLPESVGEVR